MARTTHVGIRISDRLMVRQDLETKRYEIHTVLQVPTVDTRDGVEIESRVSVCARLSDADKLRLLEFMTDGVTTDRVVPKVGDRVEVRHGDEWLNRRVEHVDWDGMGFIAQTLMGAHVVFRLWSPHWRPVGGT